MKKIFKALAISVASVAMVAGVATATACSGGYNGVYEGSYSYTNAYGATYGMRVEVTVENNIITKVRDLTNTDLTKQDNKEWTVVSPGYADKYVADYNAASETDKADRTKFPVVPAYSGWTLINQKEIEDTAPSYYKWTNANASTWTTYEVWLLQQYEGWSVADVLDIPVFIDNLGQPYEAKGYNESLNSSGLLITGSTQGSGRLILAVQSALGKNIEIGRIVEAE